MKKQIVTSVLTAIATIAAILGLCLSCSVQGYDLALKPLYIVVLVAALVLVVVALLLSLRLGSHNLIVTVLRLAALILIAYVFANTILARATLAVSQFTYDSVNEVGWKALYYVFLCLGGCLVAELSLVVGAFFTDKKGNGRPL